jgi:hypothetical protein
LWGVERIGSRCAVLDKTTCLGLEVLDETTQGLYSIIGIEISYLYHQSIVVLSEVVGKIPNLSVNFVHIKHR